MWGRKDLDENHTIQSLQKCISNASRALPVALDPVAPDMPPSMEGGISGTHAWGHAWTHAWGHAWTHAWPRGLCLLFIRFPFFIRVSLFAGGYVILHRGFLGRPTSAHKLPCTGCYERFAIFQRNCPKIRNECLKSAKAF